MFHLSRTDFPDLLLSRDDLDDIAQMWLGWHEQARGLNVSGLRSHHGVRLRLWGFARQDGDKIADLLEEKLAAARLEAEVRFDDADNLSAVGVFEPLSIPCSLGNWLEVVSDRAFDGLVLFLELSVHDWPGAPDGPALAGGTIVLCGLLCKEGLLLKAAWPTGLEAGIESLYKLTVWPEQPRFLEALEMFRTGTMPSPPNQYFTSRAVQRQARWYANLLIHIPGPFSPRTGRLSSFLFRAGFHISALLLMVIVYLLAPDWPFKGAVLYGLSGLFLIPLAYVVSVEARRVWSFYWRMKAAMQRVYSRPVEYEFVNLADEGLDDDTNIKKYSRELGVLGCQHLGDIRHRHATTGKSLIRVFTLPSEKTYVYLMVLATTGQIKKFPVHVHYFILTRLTDGRIITINEGGGYRKSLLTNVFQRRFPDIDDPAVLLEKHKKFVAEICAKGNTVAPLDDLPTLLERQKEEHEEMRPLMERWGYYSWPAAFRQSFELVRREYLEPESEGA